MNNPSRRPRRTQGERTAATVAKLIQATIDAIVELGYAGATTREICERAGVSQGGLFRHFPTRRDLIVATLTQLCEERLADFELQLEPDRGGESPQRIAEQIRVARTFVRDPRNMVFLEVVMASRTEPDLRAGIAPIIERCDHKLLATASRNPVLAMLPERSRRLWFDFAQQVLWIEALWAANLPDDTYDDSKIDALVRLLFVLRDHAPR